MHCKYKQEAQLIKERLLAATQELHSQAVVPQSVRCFAVFDGVVGGRRQGRSHTGSARRLTTHPPPINPPKNN